MAKKIKRTAIFFCLATPFLLFENPALAYTLEEAVTHTLRTSPDLLIETNTKDSIDKELRQSYAGYLPSIDVTGGWGEQYTNNPTTRAAAIAPPAGGLPAVGTRTLPRSEFSLSISQMIYDGLAVYHDVEGHKARSRAEAWRVNSTAQDVAFDAVQAYLNVLLHRELMVENKRNVANHIEIFRQIKKRSESGIGKKADLDQAEARVALARTNMLAEEGNLRDAETEFLRKIGIPVPEKLQKPEKPKYFPASEQEAINLGLQYHPLLRASSEDINVVRAEHKGARSPFFPRINLQLEMSRDHNIDGTTGNTNDALAILRMNWNLFSGGKDQANISRTAYKLQEAQEVKNRAHRQVVETIRLAWSAYETARKQMPWFKDHAEASYRTADVYQKQFNIGQRTLLDLLDAENELFAAKTAFVNAKYTELIGRFHVLSTSGILTERLAMDLPRQADPKLASLLDGKFGFFDSSTTRFE